MKVRFSSDTSYRLFEDQADWRFASNFMTKDERRLEIVFERDVPSVLVEIGRDLGGDWSDV
mgnify:CR=1 FL=1